MGRAKKYHLTGRNSLELTLADLPAPDTRRWYETRKILVVRAIEIGMLSFDQASERYSLSLEEFIGWQKLAAKSGKGSVNPAIRKALRAGPLWIGSDRDSSQAPLDADLSDSF
jgi:hypothetical protein